MKFATNYHDPVHLLAYENQEFLWIKSKGGMSAIWRSVNKPQKKVSEVEIVTFIMDRESVTLNQPVLISDTAGMGKSLLLAAMGRRIQADYPQKTVVFVVAGEFIQVLKDKKFQSLNMKSKLIEINQTVIDFASDNEFGKTILSLKWKPENSGEIVLELMLDGFDEITLGDFDLAYHCITFLVEHFKYIRLWITTRPHYLHELENRLQALGYNIEQFDTEDQIRFLKEYLGNGANVEDKVKLSEFASTCLAYLKKHMNAREQDVAGIPLLCLIIGEVYKESAEQYLKSRPELNPHIFKSNSLIQLYEQMVAKKFETAMNRYKEVGLQRPDIMRQLVGQHQYLSVFFIFPARLNCVTATYGDFDLQQIYNTGILEPKRAGPLPRFIHWTFAEYFVATFVKERLCATHASVLDATLDIRLLYDCLSFKKRSSNTP